MTTARSKNYKRSIAATSILEVGKLPQKLQTSSSDSGFKTNFFGIFPIISENDSFTGAECYFRYYSNALEMLDDMNHQAKEEFDIPFPYFEIRKLEVATSEFDKLSLSFEDD